MALETLKDVKEIGGYQVGSMYDISLPRDKAKHVGIDFEANAILFVIQNGPIKEVGENGCQVETLIYAARDIIAGLNEKFPCKENRKAIASLADALFHLKMRKANREKRGVEGTSNA